MRSSDGNSGRREPTPSTCASTRLSMRRQPRRAETRRKRLNMRSRRSAILARRRLFVAHGWRATILTSEVAIDARFLRYTRAKAGGKRRARSQSRRDVRSRQPSTSAFQPATEARTVGEAGGHTSKTAKVRTHRGRLGGQRRPGRPKEHSNDSHRRVGAPGRGGQAGGRGGFS